MNRKKIEQAHFDQQVQGKSKEATFYDTTFVQNVLYNLHTYSISQIGNPHDKRILFYGCGASFRTTRVLAEQRERNKDRGGMRI